MHVYMQQSADDIQNVTIPVITYRTYLIVYTCLKIMHKPCNRFLHLFWSLENDNSGITSSNRTRCEQNFTESRCIAVLTSASIILYNYYRQQHSSVIFKIIRVTDPAVVHSLFQNESIWRNRRLTEIVVSHFICGIMLTCMMRFAYFGHVCRCKKAIGLHCCHLTNIHESPENCFATIRINFLTFHFEGKELYKWSCSL